MRRLMSRLIIWQVFLVVVSFPAFPVHAALVPAYNRTLIGTVPNPAKVTQTSAGTVLGVVQASERVIIDGRDAQNTWWHIESSVGTGYIAANSITITGDVNVLPVVAGDLPAPEIPKGDPVSDPTLYPILPKVSDFTRSIYQHGRDLGNAQDIFTEAGDCMTADNLLFLGQFSSGTYDLGQYTYLGDVIGFYNQPKQPVMRANQPMNSFAGFSEAAHTGFTAESVEDSTWSDPNACTADETPLACEFRESKASIVLIMFGTNDVTNLTSPQFDFYLRLIVHDSISTGTIPLLSTFPGDPRLAKKSLIMNQIVFNVAHDYDVPIMNLWAAIQPLPGNGRQPASAYLTRPPDTAVASFTTDSLKYGYTMRNLITLQSLNILYKGVILPGS